MKVSVCCIAKKENRYIREFVEHYLNIGVDNIFIFDNNEKDGETFDEVIGDYIASKKVFILDIRGKHGMQLKAYNAHIDSLQEIFDFTCFFDVDEFLMFKSHTSIKEYLSEFDEDVSVIKINWKCYDDNGLLHYEDKHVVERFTRECVSCEDNKHVKSIIARNAKCRFIYDPHCPYCEGKVVNEHGGEAKSNSPFETPSYEKAWINHYVTKTAEEFAEIKRSRGDATIDTVGVSKKCDEEFFFHFNEKTDEKECLIKKLISNQTVKYSVLTYIFGGYEFVREVECVDENVEYVLVTDDKTLTSNTWTIKYLENKSDDIFENCYEVRFHPFKYVSNDIVVRIDASMSVKEGLSSLVSDFAYGGYNTALVIHPERNTLLNEYAAWVHCRGYDGRRAVAAIKKISEELEYNIYDYKGLYQLGFAIQRNNDVNKVLNDKTFKFMKELSVGKSFERLDQTIFSAIVNKNERSENIMWLSEKVITDSPYIQLHDHNSCNKVPMKGNNGYMIEQYAFDERVENLYF